MGFKTQRFRATIQARSIQQTSIIKIRFPESTRTHAQAQLKCGQVNTHKTYHKKDCIFTIIIHKRVDSNSEDHTRKRIQLLPEAQRTEKFETFFVSKSPMLQQKQLQLHYHHEKHRVYFFHLVLFMGDKWKREKLWPVMMLPSSPTQEWFCVYKWKSSKPQICYI